jgi:hypothetical protein
MKLPVLAMLSPALLFAADLPDPSALPVQRGLPDPLVTRHGPRVMNRDQWEKTRKPELRVLFEQYMYGRWPTGAGWKGNKLLFEDKKALNGTATVREFAVDVGLDAPVQLLVATPNGKTGPSPCFLGLNFYGNHTLLDLPGIALPKGWVRANRDGTGGNTAHEEDRGKEIDVWNIANSIQRGYAVATFYQGDLVPDEAKLAGPALEKLDPAKDFETPEGAKAWNNSGTATIAAWAWGFSQMLSALEKLPEIDPKRVATVGHSRNGKTALLAAAFDERFAMAIPSQAGSGGTGPSRVAPELAKPNANGRPTAETVAVITKSFPHWFCKNFSAFADDLDRLPFDQHCLIAMCAPRPVLVSNATEDLWANPAGQFEMLAAAAPVYQLYGEAPLGSEKAPQPGQLLKSRLGYFIRTGKHSMIAVDWAAWLDYADQWLK